MSAHAHKLQLALLLSLGIAGPVACGEKEEDDTAGMGDDGGEEEGGEEEGGEEEGGEEGGGGEELDAIPAGDYPECSGDTGMSYGQCCVDVYCIDYPSGSTTCPATADISAEEITGKSLGSGDCLCDDAEGPYAPDSGMSGDCCYLVGIQACEGRPLVVEGGIRRARLVRGKAWR